MTARFRLAALAASLASLFIVPSVAQADDYIVVLKDGANEARESAAHTKQGADVKRHFDDAINGYAAEMSARTVAEVRSDRNVDFVAKSRSFYIPRAPRDQTSPRKALRSSACDAAGYQGLTTGLRRIGGVFSTAISGNCRDDVPPVGVAIIDTGVDYRHSDLHVSGAGSCVPGLSAFEDVDGHGTFIAGVIAALDNQFGISGIAPGANLFSIRVTPDRSTAIPTAALICALDTAISTRQDADPANDIHVANMSLSGPGADDGRCGKRNNDPIHMAICRATRAGITVVSTAGNVATDVSTRMPGSYDEVLTATAMGDYDGLPGGQVEPLCNYRGTIYDDSEFGQADDQFAFYSGYATLAEDRAHTVAAPGNCIDSTAPLNLCYGADAPPDGECYDTGDGTSYAAPYVSGVAALCIAYRHCKRLSADEIRRKLVHDAARYNLANPSYGYAGDPLRPVGSRWYGWLLRAGIY